MRPDDSSSEAVSQSQQSRIVNEVILGSQLAQRAIFNPLAAPLSQPKKSTTLAALERSLKPVSKVLRRSALTESLPIYPLQYFTQADVAVLKTLIPAPVSDSSFVEISLSRKVCMIKPEALRKNTSDDPAHMAFSPEEIDLMRNLLRDKAAQGLFAKVILYPGSVAHHLLVGASKGYRDEVVRALQYLKEEGIDINTLRHPNGNTALHIAAEKKHRDVCLLLLQDGIDPAIKRSNDGKTALHLAAATLGAIDTVECILSYLETPRTFIFGGNFNCKAQCWERRVLPLVMSTDNKGQYALQDAVSAQCFVNAERIAMRMPPEVVAQLFPSRLPLPSPPPTRLFCRATRTYSLPVLEALQQNKNEIIKLAWQYGFNTTLYDAPVLLHHKMDAETKLTRTYRIRAVTVMFFENQQQTGNITRQMVLEKLHCFLRQLDIIARNVISINSQPIVKDCHLYRGICTHTATFCLTKEEMTHLLSFVYSDQYDEIVKDFLKNKKQHAKQMVHEFAAQQLMNAENQGYFLESTWERLRNQFNGVVTIVPTHASPDQTVEITLYGDEEELRKFCEKVNEHCNAITFPAVSTRYHIKKLDAFIKRIIVPANATMNFPVFAAPEKWCNSFETYLRTGVINAVTHEQQLPSSRVMNVASFFQGSTASQQETLPAVHQPSSLSEGEIELNALLNEVRSIWNENSHK